MPPTEETTVRRVGADGETAEPTEPTNEVVTANIPGDDESQFVTLMLSHPLNERDRQFLGLPADASTEVGQKVRVNKNGAKAIISAGYATVDPEDGNAVRAVLRGESADDVEPTAEPTAEAPVSPALNPPAAPSNADSPSLPNEGQPAAKPGAKSGASGTTSGSSGSGS